MYVYTLCEICEVNNALTYHKLKGLVHNSIHTYTHKKLYNIV